MQNDEISKALKTIENDISLIKHDLNYHIRRTDLLTEHVNQQEAYFKESLEKQAEQNNKLLDIVANSNKHFTSLLMKVIITSVALLAGLTALFKLLLKS